MLQRANPDCRPGSVGIVRLSHSNLAVATATPVPSVRVSRCVSCFPARLEADTVTTAGWTSGGGRATSMPLTPTHGHGRCGGGEVVGRRSGLTGPAAVMGALGYLRAIRAPRRRQRRTCPVPGWARTWKCSSPLRRRLGRAAPGCCGRRSRGRYGQRDRRAGFHLWHAAVHPQLRTPPTATWCSVAGGGAPGYASLGFPIHADSPAEAPSPVAPASLPRWPSPMTSARRTRRWRVGY